MIGALLLTIALDAPAPAASPSPKPRAKVSVAPSPEPLDITPDVPTDPPQPVPVIVPTPAPIPTPLPPLDVANQSPFHVDTQFGMLATVTGDTGTDITPTFWIAADGPLAFGNGHSIGRLGARLGLSTAPGETFTLTDIKTWKAVEAGFWGGYVIGSFNDVTTTVLIEGDFASRLKGSSLTPPLNRLVRSAGAGLRFDHAGSSSNVTMLAGFDESTASCTPDVVCTGIYSGFAVMIYGQLGLISDSLLITGDVSLSMGAGGVPGFKRRDVLRIGLVLDPVQAIKVIKRIP